MQTNETTTTGAVTPVPPVRTRRVFMIGAMAVKDPNPALTINEVKAQLAATYPDLTNSGITLEKTEEANGVKTEMWQCKKSVGTKG